MASAPDPEKALAWRASGSRGHEGSRNVTRIDAIENVDLVEQSLALFDQMSSEQRKLFVEIISAERIGNETENARSTRRRCPFTDPRFWSKPISFDYPLDAQLGPDRGRARPRSRCATSAAATNSRLWPRDGRRAASVAVRGDGDRGRVRHSDPKPKSFSVEEARRVFRYDPETGALYWRISPKARVSAGTQITSANGAGYLQVTYKGKNHKVHHIVWAIIHGAWPTRQIDHDDRDRTNNRPKNLRKHGPRAKLEPRGPEQDGLQRHRRQ